MRWTIPLAVIVGTTSTPACVHVDPAPSPARQAATAPALPAPAPAPAPATPAASEAPVAPAAATAAAPQSADEAFARDVAPVLARRCTPCHNPGGKMYDTMPFDKAATVRDHRAGILRRLKGDDHDAVARWLGQ